jgi:phytoene dehydrogenase-like protein
MEHWDAVVIGAGPNGLVAANMLADAGWDVLVLEAQDEPGEAVRTAQVTAPGFHNDLFSAFYPLAARSPLAALELERQGLVWTQAPAVVAHPTPDGPTAVLHRSPAATAASLDRFADGDGDAWLALYDRRRRLAGAVRPTATPTPSTTPPRTAGAATPARLLTRPDPLAPPHQHRPEPCPRRRPTSHS